jgi:hypothetical protein
MLAQQCGTAWMLRVEVILLLGSLAVPGKLCSQDVGYSSGDMPSQTQGMLVPYQCGSRPYEACQLTEHAHH